MRGQTRSRRTKHLTFSDDVHSLDSLDDSPCRAQGTWPLHGPQPSFDASVIQLNAIVCVLKGPVAAVWIQTFWKRLSRIQTIDRRAYSAWIESVFTLQPFASFSLKAGPWPPHDLAFPTNRRPPCLRDLSTARNRYTHRPAIRTWPFATLPEMMFLHGNIYLFQASHFSNLKALRMPSSLNQPASMRSDGGIPGTPNWPVDCKI